MDPLARIKELRLEGTIPDGVCDLVLRRFRLVLEGIARVERASGMDFPVAYVEPAVIISPGDRFGYGILFARTVPLSTNGRFQVVIQISAPLVAYGLKGTVHAVLAHEFLHYLDLARRISQGGLLSDEITGNMFESAYADRSRTMEPKAVFSDRALINHITKRFGLGFRDVRLEEKTVRLWINKGLPKLGVALDSNTVSLSAQLLSRASLPSGMGERLEQMYQKSQKISSKNRLY